MSRTDKDLPWKLGGNRHKYLTSDKHHAWFTREMRRRIRKKAKAALRRGEEPAPRDPLAHEYFD